MTIDVFQKHRIILRCIGILLPGDLENSKILRVIVQIWFYYMAALFPTLILGFLLGVLIHHKEYIINMTLYAIAGVVSSTCVGMKFMILVHHRQDIRDLTELLKGFKADTRLGRITITVSNMYEIMAVTQRVVLLGEIISQAKVKSIMPFWTPYPRDDVTVALFTYIFVQGSAIIKTLTNFFIDTLFLRISNQTCHRLFLLSNTYKLIGLSLEEKKERLAEKHMMRLPKGMDLTDEALLKFCIKEHIALIQ